MQDRTQPQTAKLTVGQRAKGLNQITRLRSQYWGDDGKTLRRFVADMQDKRDPQYAQNSRALSALLFLAGIPASRHALPLEAFTPEEREALITAMNQFRAMVSLFPKRLTIPL